ncbi:MAG: flagellin [Fibrobacterota bacterium]
MRIGNFSGALYNRSQKNLQSALMKLSTAQKINSASDNAAGLAIAEKMNSRVRGFKVAGRNVQDSMSALNVEDGAGERVTDILQRQRELALQAGNGTLSDQDRSLIDKEYQQLNSQIEEIAQDTEFNGQQVADGTELASGDDTTTSGPDGGDTINMPQTDFSLQNLGMDGSSVATGDDAQAALSSIDEALENVGQQRAEIGSTVNRFSSAVNTIQTAELNTVAAESVIRDQDMAKGIADLTKNQLLNQTGNRAFSMFRKISSDHIMNLLQ